MPGPPPTLSSINPNTGPPGITVQLSGVSFGSPGSVQFGGFGSAAIVSWTNTLIYAIVPPGTTGVVNVVVNGTLGATNSLPFTGTGAGAGPHITSLTPSSGPTGITVVIAGTGFGATQGTSTVKFNGVAASVVSWSATSITAVVPATATTGPVVVRVLGVDSNGVTFTVSTASNGGTGSPLNLLLIPVAGPNILTLDPTNFDDPNSPSYYTFKVEDVRVGRQPTINKIYISHRDLGQAVITVTIKGNNDLGKVISKTITVNLGTVDASGRIITTVYDQIAFTCQNPQIRIDRGIGAGPVSITKVFAEGRVEK